MNAKWLRYSRLSILSFLGALLLWVGSTIPSYAHWADLAVAEIVVGKTDTQITLTFPTGLIASADDNRDGELSLGEFRLHQAELQSFLNEKIHLTNGDKESGVLTVEPSQVESLPPNLKVTKGSHSTLLLTYTWSKPVQGLVIRYDLFCLGYLLLVA